MFEALMIAGRPINNDEPPFIIAEMSGNHDQCLSTAEKMIVEAKSAGVSAIKFQTYTADTITLNSTRPEFQIKEESSLWQGENLYSLYERAHTPWEWHRDLFTLARDSGLIAFSSPFDESSVEFLESLDAPCYKIASFEINHFPLLKAVAETGKPIIMSTGMSTLEEIEEAVAHLQKHGCRQLALLKCTSAYPAPVSDANLQTISHMKSHFNLPVGLSDHSKGIGVSLVAVALGANIIERHFVLAENSNAVDAPFSSTPEDMAQLVKQSQGLSGAMGSVHYGPSDSECDSLKYRRSIYVADRLKAGDILTKKHIRVVRPGLGMHPKYFEAVIGRTLRHDKEVNTPLLESDLL